MYTEPDRFSIKQLHVLTRRRLLLLLLLSVSSLICAGGIVLWGSGVLRILGGALFILSALTGWQLLYFAYNCIDRSELQLLDLRRRLYSITKNNPNLPDNVRNAILHAARTKADMITYSGSQRDVALNSMLTRIIDGNFSSLEQINQALAPYQLHLEGEMFSLVLFHTIEIPDDAFDLDLENSLRIFGYPNPLAAFFRTIICEILGAGFTCLSCETNGIFRCIVTAPAGTDPEIMEMEVQQLCARIVDVFYSCLSISILSASTQIHQDFSNINAANQELTHLMDCRSFIGDTRKVLSYRDLEAFGENDQHYRRNLQICQEFLELLHVREFDKARALCGSVISQCHDLEDSSYTLSRLMLNDMAFGCIYSSNLSEAAQQAFHKRLLSLRAAGEYRSYFDALITHLEELSRQHQETEKWTLRMADYIDHNFTDPDLSVSTISELFHYNPIYATKQFKLACGVNISDYIQAKRLERSKSLLGQGFTVKEIAEKSGFRTVGAMTRVYNKVYGVAPGKLNAANSRPAAYCDPGCADDSEKH